MTTSFDSVAKLSERELLDHFAGLVARDRRTTAELLVAIAEIDERKLWAAHACSSMFTFCMERFRMSEPLTAKRIWAARTTRRFPVILGMVERGELHLGAIHLLSKHLTAENHARVLERARHKSCREVEQLVAELAPREDAPSRIRALPGARGADASTDSASTDRASTGDCERRTVEGPAVAKGILLDGGGIPAAGDPARRSSDVRTVTIPDSRAATRPIVPLSPRRYKIEITVDQATHDKLRSLQDLLARSGTGRDPAAIITHAIEALLARTLARKAACTDRPKTATPRTKSAMHAASAMPASPEKRPAPCVAATAAPEATPANLRQRSRGIPAAVRREVWQRDSGRCCYVDARGLRCRETGNVEFHHRTPFALGGPSTTENIELRCAAHNQYQADIDFGRAFMDARRGKAAAA